MTWVLAGILGAASLVAPSAQNAAPPATGLIHAPTVLQYLSAYPRPALDSKLSGKVNLHCAVEVDGALTRCVAAEETPAGKGFGAASLTLSPFFKLGPGPFQPGDVIDIPLTWTPTGFAPAQAAPLGAQWEHRASANDFTTSFPEKARKEAKSGDATLACSANSDGTLKNCTVYAESPEGYGFGKAALTMVPLFRLNPSTSSYPTSLSVPLSWTSSGEPGPQWVSKPTSKDYAAAYPERAARMEKTGTTSMQCKIQSNGFVSDCSILSESPRGFGFGDAALEMAPLFRMGLADGTVGSTGGATITIPMTWVLR